MTLPSAAVILHRTFHLEDIMHMGVQFAGESANGVQVVHVDAAA